jgi:3-hydroxybutyryl-CoA dehydrogenase
MREAFEPPLSKCSAVKSELLVVGGGAMGTGIAVVAARADYAVTVVEPDPTVRERGQARAAKDGVSLSWLDAIPAQSQASIAIEAVTERLTVKREVFQQLEKALRAEAVLASNTSSLEIQAIAEGMAHPERVVGLHFFNPPQKMQLVEIVERESNSDEAIESVRAFVERIGKTAVFASDTPGFIVNRVARPFYLQSMLALERGVASAPELDALARSIGFRMGPFELMDLIGLDVNLATSESVFERLQAEHLEPLPMQRALVAEGRLGRKSGSGFYDYTAGEPEKIDLHAAELEEDETNLDEVIAVLGYGGNAEPMVAMLDRHVASVQQIEFDGDIEQIDPATTVVIDLGDGVEDRSEAILALDAVLEEHVAIFVDAYATDINDLASRMRHPERLVGYGLLGALESQHAVEIVDSETVSDDALALAQEVFELMGMGVMLVENVPGLFLGRVVGSIVNEAMVVIHDGVAVPEDVDLAMKLGVNYPRGPVEWGREIGGARIAGILRQVAAAEDSAFGPHRSLWVLDAQEPGEGEAIDAPSPLAME